MSIIGYISGRFYMVIKDEKFYTWDELVEKFPDKWVIVEGTDLSDQVN